MSTAGTKRKKIPYRNKSPFGWWIASYIERFEHEDDGDNPNRRCIAWENTIIIKAKDREAAFRKANRIGRSGLEPYKNTDGKMVRWIYEGLTSLLPIYEELEDGAEILWKEHRNRSVKKIKSLVRAKEKLETFDDDDDA